VYGNDLGTGCATSAIQGIKNSEIFDFGVLSSSFNGCFRHKIWRKCIPMFFIQIPKTTKILRDFRRLGKFICETLYPDKL